MKERQWLEWAQQLQAIAQNGLAYLKLRECLNITTIQICRQILIEKYMINLALVDTLNVTLDRDRLRLIPLAVNHTQLLFIAMQD